MRSPITASENYYDINFKEVRDVLCSKVGEDLGNLDTNDRLRDASLDMLKAYSAFQKKLEKVGMILLEGENNGIR